MSQAWNAKWIWDNTPENMPNVYIEARKVFLITAEVQKASLRISANQEYKLYVNGLEIGSGPSPSDNDWKYYDTYDVLSSMKHGENCIAIVVYNFGTQDIVTQQRQGPGGLITQLDMATTEGEVTVYSDEEWKCRRSPRWVHSVSRMHQWSGFKEIYLADQEDGWEQPDYDDTPWEKAVVIASVNDPVSCWPRLISREIPFLSREIVKPVSIQRIEENYGVLTGAALLVEGNNGGMTIDASVPGSLPSVVLDFGMEQVGYPEIEVNAPSGGVLHLSYGESLELTLLDTFILKKGINRLSPFGRRAFRYVKLSVQGTPLPINIHSFRVQFVHYPFKQEGAFLCSDPLLNKIWGIGRYTTLVNSQDHLEDCPYREQALWVVDAVVMAKVIYHTYGDTLLVRKCLLQGARIQNEDGSIPGTGPERNSFVLPDFNAYWFLGVYDYWRFSGDDALLTELKDPILRLIDWFNNQEDENGLFTGADREGWWCFVDWADYIDKRDRVTAISCLHYKLLRKAEDMAGALGELALADDCNERANRLYESIRKILWVPEKQLFTDCLTDDGISDSFTYQTNFLAVWSGLMTDRETEYFVNEIFEKGICPELKGAFFYHIVFEVLFDRGYVDMAMDIIRTYWGEMVERGATTWWETFDPSSPHSTIPSPYLGNTPTYLSDHIPVSQCHGWSASPTYILTQKVLGIDISTVSSGEFRFQPNMADLTWVKGRVPNILGWIEAECIREPDGTFAVTLEYPATLTLHSPNFKQKCEDCKGDTIIVRGKIVTS